MKNNRMSKLYVFPWIWLIAILLMLLTAAILSSGCKIQDIKSKETRQTDSTVIKTLSETIEELQKSNLNLTQLVKEMEQSSVTFTDKDCDTTIVKQFLKFGYDSTQVNKLFDALAKQRNEIEYLSNGTIRIKGRLSAMTFLKQRTDSLNYSLKEENSRLKVTNDSLLAALKTKEAIKQKDVKAGIASMTVMIMWVIFLLFVLLILLRLYNGKIKWLVTLKRFLHL